MSDFNTLIGRCKGSVHVSVNNQRDTYKSLDQALDDLFLIECPPDVSPDVLAGIRNTGNLVELYVYPTNSISFYYIVHFDFDEAVKLALAQLDADGV